MANVTPDYLRGLLIPKAQITKDNIWRGESSFTQANPRAGIPKPRQIDTGLVLSCVGSQDDNYNVETTRGGLPGSAGFIWSQSDGVRIGKNHFNLITDSKIFRFGTTATTRNFDCVADSDGNLYVVQEEIAGTARSIKVHKQARDGVFTQKANLVTTTDPSDTEARPMITLLPDESILVAYFNYTEESSINMTVWRSYDRGENWTKISSRALLGPYVFTIEITPTVAGYTLGKTNMITVGNNVLLVIEQVATSFADGNDALVYVSRDNGTTFTSIRSSSGQDYHQISAIALDDGQYSITYLSAVNEIRNLIVPDVSLYFGGDFEDEKAIVINNSLTFCTLYTDPVDGGQRLIDGSLTSFYSDGRIYVIAKRTNNDILGWVSEDLGQSWDWIGRLNDGAVGPGASAYVYPVNNTTSSGNVNKLKSCLWEGFALLLGDANDSILGLYLGGYSEVTYPAIRDQAAFYQYFGNTNSWLPHFQPEDSSLYTTSGTGSRSLISDGLQIQTSGNNRHYTVTAAINPIQAHRFKLKVSSGGALAANQIAFSKYSDDAAFSYTCEIRFNTAQFAIFDHTATAKHTQNIDMTDFVEFIVSVDKTAVDVYYRAWDEKQAKRWNKISVTLGTQATGLGNQTRWGHIANSTSTSVWGEFHFVDSGTPIDDSEIRSATYPTFGTYTYIDQGLNLTAKESPAREGDEYEIEPRYDFPVDNIFHEVAISPRIVWRSQNDTSDHVIGVLMDEDGGANEPSLELGDVAGLHLSNINFQNFVIQFWDVGTMAWVDHMTVNVSDGLTGTFQRKGNTLQPNSTGNPFYLHYGECAGWRAILGTGPSAKIVKLKTNSEGVWGTDSTHKRAVLMIDSKDVNLLSLPASGDIKLVPDSITITTELLQTTNPGQEAFAIKIPVQDTIEGYFQIGSMIWGHVAFMAPQYQRGRSISYEPNIQGMTTLDNNFHSRKLSSGSRTFQIAWTEPIDSRNIMSRTPDYWQLSSTVGSQPVANYGDSPFQMMGIWDYLGNQFPAVYLPSITKGQDNQVFNRYYEHALIRPTGAITIESVLGEEQQDEMFRVASITLIEVE